MAPPLNQSVMHFSSAPVSDSVLNKCCSSVAQVDQGLAVIWSMYVMLCLPLAGMLTATLAKSYRYHGDTVNAIGTVACALAFAVFVLLNDARARARPVHSY